LLVLSKA